MGMPDGRRLEAWWPPKKVFWPPLRQFAPRFVLWGSIRHSEVHAHLVKGFSPKNWEIFFSFLSLEPGYEQREHFQREQCQNWALLWIPGLWPAFLPWWPTQSRSFESKIEWIYELISSEIRALYLVWPAIWQLFALLWHLSSANGDSNLVNNEVAWLTFGRRDKENFLTLGFVSKHWVISLRCRQS